MHKYKDEPFRPIHMLKSELAQRYFPELSTMAACRKLRRWFDYCPELMEKLVAAGYHPRQRSFTAYQVKIIVEYLGEP
jgi:hypothetical protein